jgi:hypothetical protein
VDEGVIAIGRGGARCDLTGDNVTGEGADLQFARV